MNRVLIGLVAAAAIGGGLVLAQQVRSEDPAPPPAAEAPADAGAAKPEEPAAAGDTKSEAPADAAAPAAASGEKMTPIDRVAAAPQGSLKNPYSASDAAITEEGHKIFMGASCNGCHGGGGGGGMCPPLTNETWVYGGDDDTLFRLITLGSDDLKKHGYSRKGTENVVGPMPPFGSIITDEDKLWKVIAWVHSVFKGREEKKIWQH